MKFYVIETQFLAQVHKLGCSMIATSPNVYLIHSMHALNPKNHESPLKTHKIKCYHD